MSATWLTLPLCYSLPFTYFKIQHPLKCAAQTTAAKEAIQLAAGHEQVVDDKVVWCEIRFFFQQN